MRFRKKILMFVLSISIFVSSFSAPLTVHASNTVAASYSLYELLVYIICTLAAGGTTIGINATIENEEDFFQLCNDYLSYSSGISIDRGLGTVEKVGTTMTLDEWVEELEENYGSVFANQYGDDFLDKLNDMDIRIKYWGDHDNFLPNASDKKYLLTPSDQEALGTDKLWLTEEEMQELLYALYLKNHGILDNSNEEPVPSPDDSNDKPKLDYKSLAVSTAAVSGFFLAAGATTIWDNVADFFNVLLNDDNTYDTYTTLEKLCDSNLINYNGSLMQNSDGLYVVNYSYYSYGTARSGTLNVKVKPYITLYEDNFTQTSGSYRVSMLGGNTDLYGQYYTLGTLSVNCPIFLSQDNIGISNYLNNGDDSSCLNKKSPSFDIETVSNNALNLGSTVSALKTLPVEKGLSSSSLLDYVQNLLDEQDTLQNEPENYNTLLAPKIENLSNSATDIEYVYNIDDDSSTDEEPDIQYGNDYSTDSEYEVITEPETMPLPAILPFGIPSVAQKVTGPEDWEYNYSPYFISILSVLFIDFETIKTHTMGSLEKIPTFNNTQVFFDSIGIIADSINDDIVYPVISMNTPDILLSIYPENEIIIYDCSEHANYYSFIRSIMSVTISIGFIMWLLRQIKITFSIK